MNGTIYAHILLGTFDNPDEIYLTRFLIFPKSLNESDVAISIDEDLRDFNVGRDNYLLLVSDSAMYMVSAGQNLKLLNPNLLHCTCISNLMHNAAETVRARFNDADRLISSIKSTTVKNETRKQFFISIGSPPPPVITRWGSWIEVALYYSKPYLKSGEFLKILKNLEYCSNLQKRH